MKNEKIWEESKYNSIRQKVAEFIDKNPAVSDLKNETYYAFEDAMIDFIYQNRNIISKEVDLEFQRDDFLTQAQEEFGEDVKEAIKVLPIEVIDDMICMWQESLGENDEYWEIVWDELSNVLTDGGVSPLVSIDNYTSEDILIYAAYLKEWYADMPPEMQGQAPACIDEFFSSEMEDEELSKYYIKAAKNLFGDRIKRL